jgi:hypothetical protein
MSKPKTPQAPPPPPDPYIRVDAENKRLAAESAAIAESKANGRRSTIHAGAEIADEEQRGRGLLSQRKRQAAQDMFGG